MGITYVIGGRVKRLLHKHYLKVQVNVISIT